MFQLKKFEQVIAMKKVLKLKLLVYAAVFLSKWIWQMFFLKRSFIADAYVL